MNSDSKFSKFLPSIYHEGIKEEYLFNWGDIPGNDNWKLTGFLKKRFGIDWVENAKIEKIDDGKTIKLSFKNDFISLGLNDQKTEANLKINDDRIIEFCVKTENDKLNIYIRESPFLTRYIKIFEYISNCIEDCEEHNKYLFSWDDIPGNDNWRLTGFLIKRFGVDWVETAKIEKIDDGNIIKLSFKNDFLFLELNDQKTEVTLTIDNVRTDEFIAKTENGKINIYLEKETIDIIGDLFYPRFSFLFSKTETSFLPQINEKRKAKFKRLFGVEIDEFLEWFAGWVDLTLKEKWTDQKKREIISKIIPVYRMRGTKKGLEECIKLYTGQNAEVIDELKKFQVGKTSRVGKFTPVGGFPPYFFKVNLTLRDHDIEIMRKDIEEIINKEKPAHTRYLLNMNAIKQ